MATQSTALYDIMLKHEKSDYRQYNAEHRYRGWMGKTPNAIIQRNPALSDNGETVRLHFTDDIGYRNIGVGSLEGNEATFGTDYHDLKPFWFREAVKLKKSEAKKAITNQAAIQRHSVRTWMQNMEYQEILHAFDAVAVDATAFADTGAADGSTLAHSQQVSFLEASEAQRDAFLTANADRVQVGNGDANVVAGDMSASLLNLTPADDGIGIAFLESLRRKARRDQWAQGGARPIRPVSTKDGGVTLFKVVIGEELFDQLFNDEDIKRYNTDARIRGVENHPIFEDGDLLYRSMTICGDSRVQSYGGLGAGGATIHPVYFFGAQALGAGIGQRMKYTKSDLRDYEFYDGVGVEAQQCFEKLFYQGGARAGKQHGMITGFCATA